MISPKLYMAFPARRKASCLVVVVLLMLDAVGGHSNSSSSSSASSAPTKCFPQDLAALQEFAASFAKINSTNFFVAAWRPQHDCCSWEGVTCAMLSTSTTTNYARVVGLSISLVGEDQLLGEDQLAGNLPNSLCRLSALSSLELSYVIPDMDSAERRIAGPIPSCIGHNLTNLQHLLLQNNHLNSTIPHSFSRLLLLQTLDLSYNHLSGSISPIANLPRLQYLDLDYNYFTGTLPSLNTPSLADLSLAGNAFSGTLPPFNYTPNLQYLYLSANSFSGAIPPFNSTPKLKYLHLVDNELLTGDVFPSLSTHLTHLEQLSLDQTSLTSPPANSISRLFCNLTSLNYLSMQGGFFSWQVEQHSPRSLDDPRLYCERPSVNLTYLDLSSNHLTGPFPSWIALFPKLDSLDLSNNNFSGPIPQEWQSLTQLTILLVSGGNAPSTDHQQMPSWLFRLPLEVLSLRSIGLTTRGFQCELGLSLLNQTLMSLDLSDNHLSAGLSLWQCLAHHNFTALTELSLSNNPLAFSLTQFSHLPEAPIYSLDLSFCQLSGKLTMEILSSATYLHLAHNHLAGSIPSQIGSLGTNLVWLDLSFNNLTGLIPSSMGNLSATNAMVLNNNNLHGDIPSLQAELGSNFTKFGILNLANNHFTKALFHNTHFFSLLFLDLSFNKLEGDFQELLGDYSVLTNLKFLLLSHNRLTGSIPMSLGRSAPFLTVIELSNNKLTGAIPESLKLLSAKPLQPGSSDTFYYAYAFEYIGVSTFSRGKMDLSSNMLSGLIPQALGELLYLNDLNLSRNQLSGVIPSNLANLTQLESLDLSYNNLQGAIPMALAKISTLRVFNVSFNPGLRGQIPDGPQLENPDSYNGDSQLCGYQVNKTCNSSSANHQEPQTDGDQNVDINERRSSKLLLWIEEWASIPGICIAYVVGFGLTVWVLKLLNFYGRREL